MSMRKVILVIAILLVGFSGDCFGRKLADPDTLTFKKTYSMPGMSEDDIYVFTAGWREPWMEFYGSPRGKYGTDGKYYACRFYGQKLDKVKANIFPNVYLIFRDGSFDLIFTDISASWRHNNIDCLSSRDDRFNRNVFWRMSYSMKILDQIRERSKELFEIVTASMDHYLEVGPPVELKKL